MSKPRMLGAAARYTPNNLSDQRGKRWNEKRNGGQKMAQKNATPNKAQAEALKSHGLVAYDWTVVKELTNSMIVKNWDTGEFRVLEKKGCAV